MGEYEGFGEYSSRWILNEKPLKWQKFDKHAGKSSEIAEKQCRKSKEWSVTLAFNEHTKS